VDRRPREAEAVLVESSSAAADLRLAGRFGALLAAALAVAVLAIPSSANAGVYEVRACDAADGVNNSWQPLPARTGVSSTVACPSNGHRRRGLSARNVIARSGGRTYAKRGAIAGLAFTAPPDTAIVGVRAGYYFYRADPSWQAVLTNGFQVIKGCHRGQFACESVASNRFLATPPSPIVVVAVHCNATRCPTTPTDDRARGRLQALATLYSAVVSVEDNTKPAIHGVAGSLFAGGWQSGKRTASFGAADNSGISRAAVMRGRDELAVDQKTCDYTRSSPCPQAGGELVIDTTSIKPDGRHTLLVEARDAAGNVEQVPHDVLVDNTAPGSPQAVEIEGNGQWQRANAFSVRWRNPPANGGSPIAAAEYEICAAGGGSCQRGARDAEGISSLEGLAVPGPGEWVLRIWLRDAAGNVDERSATAPIRLRFDDEAPEAAFLPHDPDDPTRIAVQVTDRYSGVGSGSIELKKADATAWEPLTTEVRDGQLVATLDDTHLADGVYELRAFVADRAGNVGLTASYADGAKATVTLPLRLPTRLRVGAVGSTRDRRGKLRQVLVPVARTRVGKKLRLGGQLTSGDGTPIVDAEILVSEYTGDPGAAPTPIATLRTSVKGRFYYVAPPGANRFVRFHYAGAPRVRAAEADVPLRIGAVSSIRTSRRAVRNGQTMRFEGQVKGGFVPPAGKLVELQVLIRGAWQTFTTFQTDAFGRWRYDYRFGGTVGRVAYVFRAKVPAEATYPYTSGASRRAKVVVRG
jgi:hypothetical protein